MLKILLELSIKKNISAEGMDKWAAVTNKIYGNENKHINKTNRIAIFRL